MGGDASGCVPGVFRYAEVEATRPDFDEEGDGENAQVDYAHGQDVQADGCRDEGFGWDPGVEVGWLGDDAGVEGGVGGAEYGDEDGEDC